MISNRDAVLAAAATYGGGKPDFSGYGGAVNVFLSQIGDTLAVSTEGTHSEFGWVLDFDGWPAAAKEQVAHPTLPPVHRGFRDATLSVIDGVRQAVKGKKWCAIGHSLGGSIALDMSGLLADEGNPPEAIFLFAPARVFLDAPDALAGVPIVGWRCGGDIVPMVPSWDWRPILMHFPGPNSETAHGIQNFLDFIK